MATFWKIFFTIGAIWFVMILFRPRTTEKIKRLEQIKKYNKEHPNANPSEPLGFLGTIIFWVCFILFFAGLFFVIQTLS